MDPGNITVTERITTHFTLHSLFSIRPNIYARIKDEDEKKRRHAKLPHSSSITLGQSPLK